MARRGTSNPLSIKDILQWADWHHEWSGRWPISRDGKVVGRPEETWDRIDDALRKGGRGLPGGSSLHRLLVKRRGALDARRARPDLTREQIIEWIRLHRMRTGKWPRHDSGPVLSAPDITWTTVDRALRRGGTHLAGGESLTLLLRKEFSLWSSRGHRRLTVPLILKWADECHARTGGWPMVLSGPVQRQEHTWAAINEALKHGRCGLPGGTSLAKLLREHRRAEYDKRLVRWTQKDILAWAEAYFRRHRRWPTAKSGFWPAADAHWSTIDRALREGRQGLPGGSSLSALRAKLKLTQNS